VTLSPVRDEGGRLIGISNIVRDISHRKRAEAALRQSEDRYRHLAESLPQLVWATHGDGRAEYCNARWQAYTGIALEDLTDWNTSKLIHPDDIRLVQQRWAAALATGEAFDVEHRLRRADGEYRWHVARGLPLRDEGGKITRWFGTCTDIHEQKHTEVALRESEERFKHIVANAPFPAAVHAEDGELLMLSNVWTELTGYSAAEIPTVQAWARRAYGDRSEIELARLGKLYARGSRHHSGESQIMTRARVPLIWDFWVTPLGRLPDGRQFILTMAVDVTHRKQVEEALQLRDRAIRAATQGIIITDPNQPGNPIVYVSPGFERLTGYSAAESVGHNCRFLQGKESDPAVIERLRAAVRAGEPCTVELLNYRKDGTLFWNELSISAVRDSDERLTHYVGVQTDVTQRRRLEEQFRQSQKMEAFGQLAGGIAHDFNNLLTIIIGYSDVMLDELPGDDHYHEPLREIQRAAERSASLTRQLLAFSRKQVLDPKVLDLNEIVRDTEKMLLRVIGEDVHLATVLCPDLKRVKADAGQLEQVLVNLAVNARDAMPEGGELMIVTKNVELDESYAASHAGVRPGPHVMLALTDSGLGMSEEVKRKIFEPFFSTKEPGKGTGLGLAVVHGIVKQSEGHIEVYSELGLGTCFKIYLPIVAQSAQNATSLPSQKPAPQGTETVLFVEDEENVRLLAHRALQRCGYNVLVAGDPLEAVRISQSHDGIIDLLLTDVVMPTMNGRKLAELLQPARPEMRVLFMSGYTDDAIVRQGILNAGVGFLQKPFTLASLGEKVRESLDFSVVARHGCVGLEMSPEVSGIPVVL
jgi:PAS domain S-box-containing protein